MYVVTGAAGFIGSNIIRGLNNRGITDIIAVDDLRHGDKFVNLRDNHITHYYDFNVFMQQLQNGVFESGFQAIFHQGDISDVNAVDGAVMMNNNFQYAYNLLNYCQDTRTPFIYASTGAVYGDRVDSTEERENEHPLSLYAYTKALLDQRVRHMIERGLRSQVVGLRGFNVYGPNEQHKGSLASVIYNMVQDFMRDGSVKLFKASGGFEAGEQKRDFIHIDDVVAMNLFFIDHPDKSGIFNCGTGVSTSFNEIARITINALRALHGERELSLRELLDMGRIRYIDFPDGLKNRYQNFTQAKLTRLHEAGYNAPMRSVEEGVVDYVKFLFAAYDK